jgi:hypothetical protein
LPSPPLRPLWTHPPEEGDHHDDDDDDDDDNGDYNCDADGDADVPDISDVSWREEESVHSARQLEEGDPPEGEKGARVVLMMMMMRMMMMRMVTKMMMIMIMKMIMMMIRT